MRFIETFDLHSFTDSSISLLSAFVFGTLIGAERQYRQRTAGVRTNALVALGGAAFVDLAQRIAGDVESLRVIAYVVSGIGFLGAGAIIKEGATVRGMNTAATLWCSAAVGACVGSDMLAEGFLLTFFIIAGNTLLRPIVRAIDRIPLQAKAMETGYGLRVLTCRLSVQDMTALLKTQLEEADYTIGKLSLSDEDDDQIAITIALMVSSNGAGALETLVSTLMTDSRVSAASWSLNTDN
ncbi:MgtC/SapB family protein [Asaia krungthepensis]|uniref:Protein MgtC n=1 Tax=Asaia krungthepensis NRIC 0535 TaxID=1307925 RepID=A0ABQ0Q133_9PROT|nr:MgtC/SapB family protein [Asaia krungthepensis]GBQ86545.1 MgtC/SapB transporter [Asaia krungthepensis NRIC 0535]